MKNVKNALCCMEDESYKFIFIRSIWQQSIRVVQKSQLHTACPPQP